MAVAKKPVKPKTNKSSKQASSIPYLDELGTLMNKVGVVGFIVIILSILLLTWPDDSQKKEFFTTWFLLEGTNYRTVAIFLILLQFALLIGVSYYSKVRIKELSKRIQEITVEKKELQTKLLNRRLPTTKK